MNEELKLENYNYDLPDQMIAKRPWAPRHNAKLLVYKVKSDEIIHDRVLNLANYLKKDQLLVHNNSKVFPCRLLGKKLSGGKCEIFLLSPMPQNGLFEVLIKTARKKKIGDEYYFDYPIRTEDIDGLFIDQFISSFKLRCLMCKIVDIISSTKFLVRFNILDISDVLKSFAKIPIPPYIRNGNSDEQDKNDYQTTYAKDEGSVAAPTAGLHFTSEVEKILFEKGIDRAFVTLHVGLGTFLPVKSEIITDHKMHEEKFYIDSENLKKIEESNDIIAVGTTTLRVLESSINNIENFDLRPSKVYGTDIFLYPGKQVKSIKGLMTNFHLPKSSLLMLVACLVGRKKVLALYEQAIKNDYRFFSYGDSMLVLLEE